MIAFWANTVVQPVGAGAAVLEFALGAADTEGTAEFTAAALLLGGAILTIIGGAALLQVRRFLHRPPLGALWAHGLGILALTAGFLHFGHRTGWYWTVAFVILALPAPWILWILRGLLHDRSTCRTDPGFSPEFRELLAREPVWATPDPKASSRIEDCPHFVPVKDLRTRYRVAAALNPTLILAYFAGIALYLIDVSDNGRLVTDVVGFATVLLPLNLVGLRESHNRAKRLHRPTRAVFTMSFLGYAITILLTGEAALYGAAYSWPVAILAAYRAVDLVIAMFTLPGRAACRSLPAELPVMAKRRNPVPAASETE
ncbi:hypothetical protein [Glycomyces dulcitolivorans]|uniref:hypothetical protein n=1 Tax=Glycomyces dulcitolivorans TaxID=2200759 RepID=UPI000DD4DBEA|nr:hypothetical protein [Glycomyces dulcitolivorans]